MNPMQQQMAQHMPTNAAVAAEQTPAQMPQQEASQNQPTPQMSGMQNQPLEQPQTMNPQMAQQQQQQQQQLGGVQAEMQGPQVPGQLLAGMQQPAGGREIQIIWSGLLEWMENYRNPDDQRTSRSLPCQVSASTEDGEPELRAGGWPSKLFMQLMPKNVIGSIKEYLKNNSKSVLFHPQPCVALDDLTRDMSSSFDGCVHVTNQSSSACEHKVLILMYTAEKRAFLGFIPNDQIDFVERLRKAILHLKFTQAIQQRQTGGPGMFPVGPSPGLGPAMGQMQAPMQQQAQQQQQQLGGVQAQMQGQQAPGQLLAGMQQPAGVRKRRIIWAGLLEWKEKYTNPVAQSTSRSLPCQVSASTKDGVPEFQANDWPSKLLMNLMPKHVVRSTVEYLKNSETFLLHAQPCEALDALTRSMSSGLAGCVNFTNQSSSASELKLFIMIYATKERAFLGFIPNDQTAFVEHLRKVILHLNSTQAIQQGQTGDPGIFPVGPSPGLDPAMGQMQAPMQQQAQQQQQQQQQQSMMMTSQTNPMVTGGVQLTQNNVPGQMQPPMANIGQQRPQMKVQPGFEAGEMAAGEQPGMIRTTQQGQQAGMVSAEAKQQQQQPGVETWEI
ncbi:Hypothetical predicted protein [Cloeon dipterum]|nr:Hypothetical predicted protein [Cloeon dipterum]